MSEQFLYFLQQMFKRRHAGKHLRADCYRLYDGVRHYRHDQLRSRRGIHDRQLRLFYDHRRVNDDGGSTPVGYWWPPDLSARLLFASAYGWSIERVAYRPVRNSKRLIALISAIGMSIFLQNYVSLTEGSRDVALPSLFNGQWIGGAAAKTFPRPSPPWQAVIWIVTFLAMLALTIFIRYSRMAAPAAPVRRI
nr:high-affinity branched-chain amino acid transporter permease [Salmonella sp. NCTC 7297]